MLQECMQCCSLKTLAKYTAWWIVADGRGILKCVLNKLVVNRVNGRLTQNRITWRTSVKYWRMFGFHQSRKFRTCLNDFHCPKESIRTNEWTAVDIAYVTYGEEICTLSTWCIYGFHMISNSVNLPRQHQLICLCNWQGVLFERCELNVWNIIQSNEMTLSENPDSNILYLVSPVKM
jgi:hypothetical protein